MSVTVGIPNMPSVNALGSRWRNTGVLPISAPVGSWLPRECAARRQASGCTPDASSGSSPLRMRKNPAETQSLGSEPRHAVASFRHRRRTGAQLLFSAERVRNGPCAPR